MYVFLSVFVQFFFSPWEGRSELFVDHCHINCFSYPLLPCHSSFISLTFIFAVPMCKVLGTRLKHEFRTFYYNTKYNFLFHTMKEMKNFKNRVLCYKTKILKFNYFFT